MEKLDPKIREALKNTLGNPEWRAEAAQEVAAEMAALLQQEYKLHKGQWWLFSLGEPARPLTQEEIEWHQERGDIPLGLGALEA